MEGSNLIHLKSMSFLLAKETGASILDKELKQVANGFDYKVGTFDNYDINGYCFRTNGNEECRAVLKKETPECRLFAMELSIMEELMKYMNCITLGQILQKSSSSNAIGLIRRRLGEEMILGKSKFDKTANKNEKMSILWLNRRHRLPHRCSLDYDMDMKTFVVVPNITY
ncbi:uncharacterized protein LOC119286309 [Triticum dicoccoides]|uniref:uncharacterized protein LOC119286309 n=1 Tax=Triticum dicoccoides TaxID=85692 RepID=UPI00188DFF6E|nr:uncharacterized protein LOC119286309 [Triticum dicoccoides]